MTESAYTYADRKKKYLKSLILNLIFRRRQVLESPATTVVGYYCPGYYHWITEALPRLLALHQSGIASLQVMIPSDYPAYVFESIKFFEGIVPLKFDKHHVLFFKNMTFVPHPPRGSSIDRATAFNLRKLLAGDRHEPVNEKVFISRAKSRGRKILNEEEVFTSLSERGFKLYYFEEMSFLAQVKLMSSCSHIVGIHGAGLANILFMPPGGKVTEITGDFEQMNAYNHSYMQLAGVLDLQYAVYFAPVSRRHFAYDDYDVCINTEDFNQFMNEA